MVKVKIFDGQPSRIRRKQLRYENLLQQDEVDLRTHVPVYLVSMGLGMGLMLRSMEEKHWE